MTENQFPLSGVHRNILDLQRAAAIKSIDQQIIKDHAAGYCVDELLDRRSKLVELIATGPHS